MSTLSWLMLEQTQAGFILVLSLISLFGRAQLHSCCWSHIHYLHFSVSQVTQHRKQINEDWNIQNIWGRCNSVIVTAHLQCTRVPVGKIINIYWAWRRYWAGCCQMSPPTSSYPSAWVRSHVNPLPKAKAVKSVASDGGSSLRSSWPIAVNTAGQIRAAE